MVMRSASVTQTADLAQRRLEGPSTPFAKPKIEKATYRFTPGTVRRLKLLGLEWGTRSDGETMEVALRYL
jgi:hypothetical protein